MQDSGVRRLYPKEKVTAASVEGVHLIVRNTKSWSNSELRKKCKIQEYGGYTGTDEGGPSGGTSGGTEQGGGYLRRH